MHIGEHSYWLYLEQRRIEHEGRMRAFESLRTAMRNLANCLRDAGALARAWNLGTQNGAMWACGRVVLQRFGPEQSP